MAEHFCSIFPRRDSFIWKSYDQKRWQKAKGPLLDNQILGVVSDEGRGLYRGTYWSHKTRHAVFDIDIGSKYHQAAELQKLQAKLAAVGLAATPYQSSDSGGWHVYLAFDDWEDSSQVETILKTWLKSEKYSIESGQLEVFPSGNALRLPLQKGFGWLDPEGNLVRRREEIRQDEALASFLCDLENIKRNWSEAKNRIESQLHAIDRSAGAGVQAHRKAIDTEGFEGLWNSGRINERIEEARHYLDHGLTSDGQRHAAIYAIEHLLWFGDPSRGVPKLPGTHNDERRQRYLREWLEKNHNGYCDHIRRGNWRELNEHIRRACEWRRQDHPQVIEFVPYMVTERAADAMIGLTRKTGHLFTPADLEKANIKRELAAREKIRLAAERFSKQRRRLTIRGLAKSTGCDRHTVRRHSDIWLTSPAVVPLSKGGGDIDPGGMGGLTALGCSGSCPEKEKEIFTSEIQADPRRAIVHSTVLAAVAETSFLSSSCEGDSRQTEVLTEISTQYGELDLAASQGSAEAHNSPPLHRSASPAANESEIISDALDGCLTPCAEEEAGRRRTADGIDSWGEPPPSPVGTKAQGSSTGLEDLGYACGISSLATLSPVFLGESFLVSGLGTGQLRHRGASRGGEARCICYTLPAGDTVSGIKELSGATSRVGVRSSFRAEQKNGKTIPDVTNLTLLTTIKPGLSPGVSDEFSLIQKRMIGLGHTKTSAKLLGSGIAKLSPGAMGFQKRPEPVLSPSGRLFVNSETYKLNEKQTSAADVIVKQPIGEPFGESLHQHGTGLISSCIQRYISLCWFSSVPQEPEIEACPSCRQLLDKRLSVCSDTRVRGPPKCIQPMESQST